MSLTSDAVKLISLLNDALHKAKFDSMNENANSAQIISDLALSMSEAIYLYITTANVIVQTTTDVGQIDVPCMGQTITPGQGSGFGNVL